MSGFEAFACMPDRATSGDTIALALTALSGTYPAGLFKLTVIAKLGALPPIVVELADVGGVHSGTLPLANAASGTYAYAIKATRLSDEAVRTVENGALLVMPDPATMDTRSHAEKTLAAIEALLEGKATKDVATYSIAGRSLTRLTPDELIKWRNHYRNEVAIQRNAGKPNGGRKITLARFH